MHTRESTVRRISAILLAFVFVFVSGTVAAAECAQLAAHYLNAFSDAPMESVDAEDTLPNPCTGKREIAALDIRPGYGFVAMFASGDVHGEVDPFVATLCDDGRAVLKHTEKHALICDTRE